MGRVVDRRAARRVITVAGVLIVVAGTSTGAALAGAGVAPSPAAVRTASLTQSGRSLVWRVTLRRGFSATELRSGRRSLCLVLGGLRSVTGATTLCVAPSGQRRTPFALTRTTAHGARAVAGTVRRAGPGRLVVTFTPAAIGRSYGSLDWRVRSVAVAHGCPAAERGAATCTALYPARGAARARLHTPRLVGCTAAGPSIRYSGPPRREIALTFDDGPWNDPPSIDFVSELKRLGVPGTFFEIGDQISEFDPTGAVERAMLADGDMIGDHTWTHPDMLNLSPTAQTSELEQAAGAIRHATGFEPCLWRPPYGAVDSALEGLARQLGFLTVYWNDDPRDWSEPGVSSIIDTVLSEARDGSIVEMHFGGGPRLQTLQALPTIVADLRARGYRFVNLVQMFGLHELWR